MRDAYIASGRQTDGIGSASDFRFQFPLSDQDHAVPQEAGTAEDRGTAGTDQRLYRNSLAGR